MPARFSSRVHGPVANRGKKWTGQTAKLRSTRRVLSALSLPVYRRCLCEQRAPARTRTHGNGTRPRGERGSPRTPHTRTFTIWKRERERERERQRDTDGVWGMGPECRQQLWNVYEGPTNLSHSHSTVTLSHLPVSTGPGQRTRRQNRSPIDTSKASRLPVERSRFNNHGSLHDFILLWPRVISMGWGSLIIRNFFLRSLRGNLGLFVLLP